MLATVNSAVVDGVDGIAVRVEVDVRDGLPAYAVVGMPDAACRESRDRVRAAIGNSGLKWPSRRITVNLAPTHIRKQGAGLDLAIAIAILVADKQIPAEAIADLGMAGELGLDGSVRPVSGMIIIASACRGREFLAPAACRAEVALVRPGEVRVVASLRELVCALADNGPIPLTAELHAADIQPRLRLELADVRGQHTARFAVEVAAAGGHHLMLIGPPGAGKTMLASRLCSLLPDLDLPDALSVTKIHSAAGLPLPRGGLVRSPPFRAPHHSASTAALIGGGGSTMRPGEISLAHCGVLFMDEMGEFAGPVLDSLRQPIEDGRIRVSRLSGPRILPARFQLVAATNPCPCGFGRTEGACSCGSAAIARYLRRLSGPLMDRFDLRIQVEPPNPELLLSSGVEESTETVLERVMKVRALADYRGIRCNARIPIDRVDEIAPMSPTGRSRLLQSLESGELSGRGVHRVRLVARTLSDLADGPHQLDAEYIDQALGMRNLPTTVAPGIR